MAQRSAPQAPRVVIINDAAVARGGATGLALLSAKLLRARGCAVTYICGDDGDDGALASAGIEVIALGGIPLTKRGKVRALREGLYDAAVRDRLAAIIKTTDTPETVYHLHGWAQILSPSVFDALAPVATRTFIHAHDFFLACPNGAYFDFSRAEMCKRVPLSAGCLVTSCDKRSFAQKMWRAARQTQVLRAALGRRSWAGILQLHDNMADGLIRGGVPADRLMTVRNPAERLLQTRVEAEKGTGLAFLGRTESGKGVAMLCAAARLAKVPLRVIGSIEKRPELARDFPEVEFTGWVAKNAMAAALSDRRALVMPSRFSEPFGLVAPEASLSGLPVLISRNALLSQDIAEAGLGVAVNVDTIEALAADLTKFSGQSDADIRAMSEAGFAGDRSVAQTPDAWADQLLGLYSAALATIS